MKLNILPARTGYLWVKNGLALFAQKPVSFMGLFVLFTILMGIVGRIPYIGNYLALLGLPALNLGMMVIGNEAVKHKMGITLPQTPPAIMMALLTMRRSWQALLQLGVLYAFAFSGMLLIGVLIDGGELAKTILQGASADTPSLSDQSKSLDVALVTLLLYIPVAAAFWFAPALMNWKGMTPLKSLFSSLYTIYKNWRAFTFYMLSWFLIFFIAVVLLLFIGMFTLGLPLTIGLMIPVSFLCSALFMASSFPTFIDCFEHKTPETKESEQEPLDTSSDSSDAASTAPLPLPAQEAQGEQKVD